MSETASIDLFNAVFMKKRAHFSKNNEKYAEKYINLHFYLE